MRKIYQVFNRDFNQWSNQMPRDMLVRVMPKVWGLGISDQVIYFDGKSFLWLRYIDEMKKLERFMANKKLSDKIFSLSQQRKFLVAVKSLRKLLDTLPKSIKDNLQFYRKMKELFIEMYPAYALSIFLPGPWADSFRKVHGKSGEVVIKRWLESRRQSEGLVKEVSEFMRQWLGLLLKKKGYAGDYVKLLSVEEIEKFLNRGVLPSRTILRTRAKGFGAVNNQIFSSRNFGHFLKKFQLEMEIQDVSGIGAEFKGTVAYAGGVVKGRVHIMFNDKDLNKFKKGSILVTPMTCPEYIPAIKKAKAVLTDEGGITCHAAISARELKIPTIIGTRIATRVLKNGDIVEVDANNGLVKRIT